MNDIISTMRSELRAILKDSVADYPTKPRHDWCFDWPSQLILVVNQIYWYVRAEFSVCSSLLLYPLRFVENIVAPVLDVFCVM